jgi:hypothetical protein
MEDYTSANMATNFTSFEKKYSSDSSNVHTSLQVLPGQSNYSILVDSTLYENPSYTVVNQINTGSVPQKKKFDMLTQFYLGALTVVGLLVVYRLTYKK